VPGFSGDGSSASTSGAVVRRRPTGGSIAERDGAPLLANARVLRGAVVSRPVEAWGVPRGRSLILRGGCRRHRGRPITALARPRRTPVRVRTVASRDGARPMTVAVGERIRTGARVVRIRRSTSGSYGMCAALIQSRLLHAAEREQLPHRGGVRRGAVTFRARFQLHDRLVPTRDSRAARRLALRPSPRSSSGHERSEAARTSGCATDDASPLPTSESVALEHPRCLQEDYAAQPQRSESPAVRLRRRGGTRADRP
jgi:hypothetical protein